VKKFNFDYLDERIQACPLCGGDKFTLLFNNDRYYMGIQTVGCSDCGLIQTNPRPSEEGLSLFYERDYRVFYQGISEPNAKYIYEMNKKERLKQSASFLSQLDSIEMNLVILDIGCSEGAFFHALSDAGFMGDLYGTEPNPEFREYAKNTTDAVVFGELNEVPKKVGLVTLNHVFEHFVRPNKFLRLLRNIMDDAGYLYIDVPNADQYDSVNDIHMAHVFHFSVRTLSFMVKQAGFIIISCEEYSPLSHPKSIRLVARKSAFISSGGKQRSRARDEMETWDKIRKLSIVMKKIKIGMLVGKIPFMRRVYRAILKK